MGSWLQSFLLLGNQHLLPRSRENIFLNLKLKNAGVEGKQKHEHYNGGHFGIRCSMGCQLANG